MLQQNVEAISADRGKDSFPSESFSPKAPGMERPLARGEGEVTIAGKKEPFSYAINKIVNGVAELSVEASSAAARLFSGIGVACGMLFQKPAVGLMAATIGIGVAAEKSRGSIMPLGSDDQSYINAGSQYQGSLLWLEEDYNGVNYYASAIRLNSEYGITAAHSFKFSGGTATGVAVGTGSNYLTSPGTTTGIASVLLYPGFPADGNFNTPDIAIIKFATPLSGNDLTISTMPSSGTLNLAGFGIPAYPTGYLAPDGNSRGFQAPIDSGTPGNVSPVYYTDLLFDPSTHLALNGQGSTQDSGGLALNSAGDLVGMMDAASGLDTVGSTDILNLSQPDVNSWITENSVPAPEPDTVVLFAVGAAGLLMRRRRQA